MIINIMIIAIIIIIITILSPKVFQQKKLHNPATLRPKKSWGSRCNWGLMERTTPQSLHHKPWPIPSIATIQVHDLPGWIIKFYHEKPQGIWVKIDGKNPLKRAV